jgi:hypothetical protein
LYCQPFFLDWWFGEAPSHADLYCAIRRREEENLLPETRFKSNQMDFERKILPKIVFFHYVGFHSFEAQWIPAENVIIGAVIVEPFCPLYWRSQDAAVVMAAVNDTCAVYLLRYPLYHSQINYITSFLCRIKLFYLMFDSKWILAQWPYHIIRGLLGTWSALNAVRSARIA